MAKDLFYYVLIKADDASYDLSQDLTSLTIDEDEEMADVLKVHLSDPFKVFSHAFQEGMEMEVDLGSVDDHSIIFRGRVYKVDGDFPQAGVPKLVLHAHDNSMKMGLLKRNRPWKDKTLEQIVAEIASDEKYAFQRQDIKLRENPSFKGNGIRQQDKTDRDFLLELAAEYDDIMYVDADDTGDNFHFLSQYHIMKDIKPAVTLYYGRCGVPNRLLSFEANSDMGNIQLPRVLSGIDYKTGKRTGVITGPIGKVEQPEDRFRDENLTELRKREPEKAAQLKALISAAREVQQKLREERGSVERVAIPTCTTAEELSQRVRNQFSTSLLGMEASGATVGNHRIHAQTGIHIADAGRFSGIWYLSNVQHILNGQGYQTKFQCRR